MSRQCILELPVMATEMVSITAFPKKKYSYATKLSINFVVVCSKPIFCIFYK